MDNLSKINLKKKKKLTSTSSKKKNKIEEVNNNNKDTFSGQLQVTKKIFFFSLNWNIIFVLTCSFKLVPAVSYSPSIELWDDCEAVPVLDSRFSWMYVNGLVLVFFFIISRHTDLWVFN